MELAFRHVAETAPNSKITNAPIGDELPALLEERGWSLRELARRAKVDVAHLSRTLKPGSGRTISGEVATRIARALELSDAYFAEAREQAVIDAVRADPALRDKLYRGLTEKSPKKAPRSRSS
jgi:transcriptional regulator with XRE-family HTH domain